MKPPIVRPLLLVTCLFIVAVSALDTVCHLPALNPLSEKRAPARFPDITRLSPQGISSRTVPLPEHLQAYVKDVVKCYDDNFGLRGILVFLNNVIKVLVFKTSPSDQVIIGSHDWLYFAGDANIDYYRNSRNFTPEELAYWNYTLEAKQRWLAKRGIYYLLVFAPNKETIYPDNLPSSIRKEQEVSLQDQLLQSISPGMREHVLDLRETLLRGRKEGQVYFRTDTHWNQAGAFLVANEIIKRLNRVFPQLRPMDRADYNITIDRQPGGDLAGMFSLTRVLTEESPTFVAKQTNPPHKVELGYEANKAWRPTVYETDDNSRPRMLIMHDSFGDSLQAFLPQYFSRTVCLLRAGTRYAMHFEIDEIKRENPHIVIEEIAERRLFRFSPNIPGEVLFQ